MSGKLFTELINDETIVKLTGEMLNKKKTYKSQKSFKYELIKILSAAAAIALVIVFVNSISYLPDNETGINGDSGGNSYAAVTGTDTDITPITEDIILATGTATDITPANEDIITLEEVAEKLGVDLEWLNNNNIIYFDSEYTEIVCMSPFVGAQANPDDLMNVSCVMTGDDRGDYIICDKLYALNFTFLGIQQSFDMADVTELKVSVNGEEIESVFKIIHGYIGDKFNNQACTMFWAIFEEQIPFIFATDNLSISGKYMGVPFSHEYPADRIIISEETIYAYIPEIP